MELFSKFCLRQKLFVNKDYYMNIRWGNIFRTGNAMTFTKAILESPYKVIKRL